MSEQEKFNRPLSTAERILKQREERELNEALGVEGLEDYKTALNGMAASPYGRVVLQTIINASGVFEPINTGDAKSLLRANDRNLYLKFIRPFLKEEVRKDLE